MSVRICPPPKKKLVPQQSQNQKNVSENLSLPPRKKFNEMFPTLQKKMSITFLWSGLRRLETAPQKCCRHLARSKLTDIFLGGGERLTDIFSRERGKILTDIFCWERRKKGQITTLPLPSFLLGYSGKTSCDLQRNINVFTDLAENSCVISVDVWHCSNSPGFPGSGPRVHEKVKQSHTQGAALDNAIRGCKFLTWATMTNRLQNSRYMMHVSQRLEHARVCALPQKA